MGAFDGKVAFVTGAASGICYSCRAGQAPVAHQFTDPIPI